MQGIALEKELTFWREKLKSAPDYIALPMDHPEPGQSMPRAGRESLHLSNELARAITQASHRQNSTAFVMLTSALAITFKEWTHQADMVIGTVVAGRNHREMENVIGCFMNFLPIRTRISPNQTAREFLESVKTAVLQAQEHQDCPFEKIVEAVNPERRRNQNPLYNVALLLQNFPTELFRGEGLEVTPLCVDLEAALLDLRFEAEWTADGLLFRCEYKTDLFEAATIQQLLQSFKQILGDLIAKPTARLTEFKITAPLEAQARAARSRETKSTVAIASTFTAEPVQDSLQYWAKELNLTVQVEFAPYNQIFQQLLDPASLTSVNTRGLNVLLIRPEDWFKTGAAPTADEAERNRVAQDFVAALKSAVDRSGTPYLVLFCPASKHVAADPIQAQAMGAVERFIASQLEGLNSVQLLTASELLKFYPVSDYYDASGDELGRVPYTPVGFAALGTMIMRKWHVLQRQSAKVIVLDCDQTLWSGVCGEDGAKGISLDAPRHALQEFMRAQHQAGRLLAICSKNNEEDVREVFAHRLDMPLRSEHFIGWRTNWLPKSQNLQSLAQELNLGLDSFIFVDDNPVECAEVEANCPEVLTLQLPEDPAQIPHFLQHCWAFDHAQLTAEDRKRGEMYRENQQRDQLRTSVTSLADFISSLQLHIAIEPMSPAQAPRVSQLTHRTNQFNCTSLRRSESDIQKLARNSDILTVTVRDRFGDYGLVGVVICSTEGAMLQVETFLLSCRVLGRGVEHAVLARLGKLALERKLDWVDVHFNRSDKNKPAFDFLDQSGGSCSQGLNGGYIYRFSAQLAAKMSFNPTAKEESPKPESGRRSRRNLDGLTEKPAPGLIAGSRQNLRPQLNPANAFSRFRTIAIEADHPEKIHQAIERRASRRAAGQAGDKPPRTETERQLCAMFEQLLHVEGVGRNASFFDLGGHSLLAVRLFAELEKLTGRKLPLVTIFQSPTIE
ncbi:MAG: HAD-IIIC family phosphatase, partial [Verrucomicrobiota bacterium]